MLERGLRIGTSSSIFRFPPELAGIVSWLPDLDSFLALLQTLPLLGGLGGFKF